MADIVKDLEKVNESLVQDKVVDDDGNNHSDDKSAFRRQAFVSLGTFMLTLGAGATSGYSAVLIPQLQNNAHSKISTELISWVAAISSLPLFFGNLISGYLMERFGRRSSQIALAVPFMIGWIIIALSNNIYLILIGRFITGFCQGWLGPLGPVFVGEISTPIYRGFFLAGMSLAIASGVFLSHLFGTFMHWKYAALLCGMFPLTGFIMLLYARESPTWLVSKGRIEECMESFYWYRGRTVETKTELDKMIHEQLNKTQAVAKIKALTDNLKKPEFWKPLCIMIAFFTITQLSGVNVICAYTTTMMKALIGPGTSPYAVMLAVDILRCLSLASACVLLRTQGRRPMALISGSLTALALIALALYLYLIRIGNIPHISPIITLGLMATYMIVSNLGVVPLPWNMVGELFPTATRGLGSGISVMMTSIAFFATVKSAPALFESIGFDGTYLFYGVSTLIGTVFLWIFLPETKGKTLLQVEEHFRSSKNCNEKTQKNICENV